MSQLHLYAMMAVTALSVACSTSSEDVPARDGGTSGSGGSAGSAGSGAAAGSAGSAGSAGGAAGAAGQFVPDSGANLPLPAGCVPDGMGFVCNPVTNEGCDASAGEACEYGIDEYFTCYPPPNDVEEGGACDWEQGPFCAATLSCDFDDPDSPSGVCRRHCCTNDDCEPPETCQAFDPEFGTLGVCR